ncbi:hypothetical protein BDP27DRAFT_1322387 [Rhodocollybia butyracea]|uniref:Uncharacterized protein n=1 Tax=Rhodocollybia butyracea TaxID=206335 RepID=A0A9P5PSA6_9AGAR|nr:hypothetical protein BDP27DRAFT_1322387 [Rhodocollybia butyracea]
MSLPITSLTSSSKAEKLRPLEEIFFFKRRGQFRTREYWWGLEPGEIDIDSPLNTASVRSDIARLLSKRELTLVPSTDVIDTMLELTLYNHKHKLSQAASDGSGRRRCVEVLPAQPYTYKLRPGILNKKTPLFIIDSNSGTVQRFEYPYTNLPLFTLGCYPFYTLMHSCFALPREFQSEPQDIPLHSSIFHLAMRWRSTYPQTGIFSLPPDIAAMKAEGVASVNAAFGHFKSDYKSDSGSSSVKGLAYTPGRNVEWLQTVQPETPVSV